MAPAQKKRAASGSGKLSKPAPKASASAAGKTVRKTAAKREPAAVALARPKLSRSAAAGSGVKALRARLGITQPVMARVLGVSTRQVAALESASTQPAPPLRRRVAEIRRLAEALSRATDLSGGELELWLQEPNEGFGGLSPVEVIERGEIDRLWRLIYHLDAGALG